MCVHKPFIKLSNLLKFLHFKKLQIKRTFTCQHQVTTIYIHIHISFIQMVLHTVSCNLMHFSACELQRDDPGYDNYIHTCNCLIRAQVNVFKANTLASNFPLLLIICSLQLVILSQDIISIFKCVDKTFQNSRIWNKKRVALTQIHINF